MNDCHCLWIERWIDNPKLKSDLYAVRHRTADLPVLDIYTDGSLSTTHLQVPAYDPLDPAAAIEVQQDAAFLIPSLQLHVSTKLSLWPS